jgi:tetratricopeptide (TPR) repeat protein
MPSSFSFSNTFFRFYLALLPSVAICSAWVWLYAIALHVVRTSVFLFDVDNKPVRSAGIVAGLGLTVILGAYQASIGLLERDTQSDSCASSPYYLLLTLSGSEKFLDEAIDLCPKGPVAYYLRGARYSIAGDHDRAVADFSEDILLEAHPFYALARRAGEYLKKNEYDRAISDYNEAIKQGAFLQKEHPELRDYFPNLFYNRATAYAGNKRYEIAVEDYSEAIKLTNTTDVDEDYYRGRGNAYMAMNDYDKAIADYGEVIQSVSKYENSLAIALTVRGDAYTAKGDYSLAISDFTRALELWANKERLRLRGRAYASNGSYEKSIADLIEPSRWIPLTATHSTRGAFPAISKGNMVLQLQIFGKPSLQILKTLIQPCGYFWCARSLNLQLPPKSCPSMPLDFHGRNGLIPSWN